MRVFVTGATGFIGSAVVKELLTGGHEVVGLARSDASADAVTRAGARVHRGDLSNPDSLAAGARAAAGVLHVAFNHDWAGTPRDVAMQLDLEAVKAMAAALEGSGKPFVVTSGTAMLLGGRTGTEEDAAPAAHRGIAEAATLAAADRGVRASVVRLAPTVHGAGNHGFVPMLIDLARKKGVAAYIGRGENRWPAVHRLDAARLYRLALENGKPGARFHGVGEEGVAMRTITETIGAGLGLPVRALTGDEAQKHFDWFAMFVGLDNPTSSAITRKALGWEPREVELLKDMKENGYFG